MEKNLSCRRWNPLVSMLGSCAWLVLLLGLVTNATATNLFRVYPLGDDYFEKIYQVHINTKPFYLTISCKQRNLLSIHLSDQLQPQEAPRFNIYGNSSSPPHMGTQSYTLLKECNTHVQVDTQNFLQISRSKDAAPFFALNNLTFTNLHNTFTIKDASTKWGLGQRFQQRFRVIDGKWTLWNRDKPWKIDRGQSGLSEQTYGFQPLYLARNKDSHLYHLAYFKNTFGLLIQATQDAEQLTYHSVGGDLQFLLVIGDHSPEEVLENYHEYIGPSHLPPFWAMGYHQCRWGYSSARVLTEVVLKFKEHDLPIDTIWSDLDYMNQKMIFTVNPATHGHGQLNKLMKDHRVHFIPLIDVGVSIKDQDAMRSGEQLNVFLKDPHHPDQYYTGQVWPGLVHFTDYHHPNATKFWKQQLQRLYDEVQFSGIWLDMNEPSNFRGNEPTSQPFRIQQNQGINMMTINVDIPHYSTSNSPLFHREAHTYYGHMSTVPTFEFFKEKGKRPFIISRSNSVGSGHFAGHWTGDNVADWEFLRLSISGNFLYQIFGQPMVGADICGFYRNTNQDLCSRWMQLGSFYPFSRNHNHQEAIPQEPYALGNIVLDTSRMSLKLRYALLRQIYSILAIKKGKGSFFRPLIFEFPSDEQAYELETIETQFLIGAALMVAPIVQVEVSEREVYFPANNQNQSWYSFRLDWKTGKVQLQHIEHFEAKTKHQIKNKLPAPPLTFLRAGYALLANTPANRARDLNTKYHLLAALHKNTAKGSILGISDYENEQQLSVCLQEGCLYEITLKRAEGNNFQLNWQFKGDKGVRADAEIESIGAMEGSTKWVYSKSILLNDVAGSHSFQMAQS